MAIRCPARLTWRNPMSFKVINPRFDLIEDMARDYAKLEMTDHQTAKLGQKAIVEQAAEFDAVHMAYFCQQVISHFPDVHRACMCLTVFTNRLIDRKEHSDA